MVVFEDHLPDARDGAGFHQVFHHRLLGAFDIDLGEIDRAFHERGQPHGANRDHARPAGGRRVFAETGNQRLGAVRVERQFPLAAVHRQVVRFDIGPAVPLTVELQQFEILGIRLEGAHPGVRVVGQQVGDGQADIGAAIDDGRLRCIRRKKIDFRQVNFSERKRKNIVIAKANGM